MADYTLVYSLTTDIAKFHIISHFTYKNSSIYYKFLSVLKKYNLMLRN